MQAPKNGFFYILDRATGEFISAKNFVYQSWALSIDSVTGRPTINPEAVYRTAPKVVFPTQVGAHNWQAMAYSPQTRLVYIPAREQGMVMRSDSAYRWMRGASNMASSARFFPMPNGAPAPVAGEPERVNTEQLVAWDPLARRRAGEFR